MDGPAHGYELIQRLETKTEGRWRPSPGSVYPQLLADDGLLE
ncbi:MAG: PadR family transcriptional regulator [Acidimicrobiia bacterium]|nr:PadR family transcriptional regulator [Acidimicrobiia bacterium]